ncbi:MAG: hypothetical protein Q8P38_05660 [Candidatus Nanopelagicales bacterium]|nr:hypothetical protein [Candidatus Nanopelagicales bacterium]
MAPSTTTPSGLDPDLATHEQPIQEIIRVAHERLAQRFEDVHVMTWPRQARDVQHRADAMLIELTRHVNAVRAVAVDEVRSVGEADLAQALRTLCRDVEQSTWWIKARLYGNSSMSKCSFPALVAEVEEQVATLLDLEQQALTQLRKHHDHAGLVRIGQRLLRVEAHSPTRPHPHLPHQGRLGALARAVTSRTDAIWDTVEGR